MSAAEDHALLGVAGALAVEHGWAAPIKVEELWDLHGSSVYSLACALLGDRRAAAEAAELGMLDVFASAEPAWESNPDAALRTASRHVYEHCSELLAEASTSRTMALPEVMIWLGELALLQRAALALCFYGGHTHRQAAGVLGVSPQTVAAMLISGMHELSRRASMSSTRG